MDEVIFFRHPGSAAHVLLFDLPLPPHDISDAQLAFLASQYGLLHSATVIARLRDAQDTDREEPADAARHQQQPEHNTQPPPVAQASVSHTVPSEPPAPPSPLPLPPPPPPSPPSEPAASPVSSMFAHLNFFSVAEAQAARKALHGSVLGGSRVRAILASPRAPAVGADGRRFPISFNRCVRQQPQSALPPAASLLLRLTLSHLSLLCLSCTVACQVELMNHFVGYGRWSCGIQWLKPYNADEHGDIVAGQTAGATSERELQAFSVAASRGFPCSFACEVEVSVADRPTRDGLSVISGLQVGSQAVSHSEAAEGHEREHGMKRAVTSAYLQLFSHLALVRTKAGDVYVRDLG